MGFVREVKYLCGEEYIECDLFSMNDMRERGKKMRIPKRQESSEKQKKQNKKNALRKFNQKIHTNFTKDDLYMTFTYNTENMPNDKKEAKKDFHNFIRRVNRRRIKRGLKQTKYMGSYETKTKEDGTVAFHFHFIISGGLKREEMEDIWGKGLCNASRLRMDDKELIVRLCKYIMKESQEKEKKENTYICSRNLKEPKVRKSDYRYTHSDLENMAHQTDNREIWEKLYPSYQFIEAGAEFSEETGWHITVKMRRDVYGNTKNKKDTIGREKATRSK